VTPATKHRLRVFALGSVTMLVVATAAYAQQDTNAAATPQAGARDAVVAPGAAAERNSEQTFVHTVREWAKNTQIIERLEGNVDGWYPRLGGMTRGSGFAVGPGYRTHVFGDQVRLDVSAALSTRLYRTVDVRARWLQVWHERAEVWTDYRYENYPQENFYGVGNNTTPDMRTSYTLSGSDVALRGQVKPTAWLRLGAKLGYMTPHIGRGQNPEFLSTEEVFTDASVPGLAEQPDFVHGELSAEIDKRDVPGNPTSGFLYRATYAAWNDRTLDAYNFQRFDSLGAAYHPLTTDRKHLISGRAGVAFVNNALGDRVPFYALPYVGGQDTIRSFREFRFKDENAFWFGTEYRWVPIPWVSAALFADFGQVAHDWQKIASDLKHGFGFGIRAHSRKQTFAQLDFGFGSGEGWRTALKVGLF